MRLNGFAGVAVAGAIFAAVPAAAQGTQQAQEAQADEIVVTARRSGIPIWRVTSDTTTLVLVGAIEGVPAGTSWDPEALTEAMRKADRIMFPQMRSVTASVFAYPGLMMRWRRHATLPEGQSLSAMLDPPQRARLAALQRRGLVGSDADRKHPLHLGVSLRQRMFGSEGRSVYSEARRAISKYRLNLVPIAGGRAGPVADQLFASAPETHLPCLLAAMELAEAGQDAVAARAAAWVARRPRAAIDNPAERARHSCWPNDPARFAANDAEIATQLRGLLGEPQVTLAVLTLRSLARPGGILDTLERAGFDIQGPDWRG